MEQTLTAIALELAAEIPRELTGGLLEEIAAELMEVLDSAGILSIMLELDTAKLLEAIKEELSLIEELFCNEELEETFSEEVPASDTGCSAELDFESEEMDKEERFALDCLSQAATALSVSRSTSEQA